MTVQNVNLSGGHHRFKPINVTRLRVGMCLANQRFHGRSSEDPFYVQGVIQREEQIRKLVDDGVQRVWIDTESGKTPEDFGEAFETDAPKRAAGQGGASGSDQGQGKEQARTKSNTEEALGPDWDEACETSGLHPDQVARLPRTEDVRHALEARDVAMRQAEVILSGAKTGVVIDGDAARSMTEQLMSSILDCRTAMQFILGKDHDTPGHDAMVAHAVHVSTLAILVGSHGQKNQIGWDVLYCNALGAFLHDIGELHLPVQVHVAGVLNDLERRQVDRHPELGARMVREIPGVPEEAVRIVLEHHERLDGRGYPNSLQGRRIYDGSQMVGALDIYDAMLSPRIYRQGLPPAEAIRAVFRMAQQAAWDEVIVSRIVVTLGVFPVGTRVLMNNNQHGMVVMVNDDRLRPVVRLLTDRGGMPMTRTKLVDLQQQQDLYIMRLLEVTPPPIGGTGLVATLESSADNGIVYHG